MNVAVLCNNSSAGASSRPELINQLHEFFDSVYVGGVKDKSISAFYSPETAVFLPIEASRNNTNPFRELKSLFSVKKQIRNKKIEAVIIYGVKNHGAMSIGAYLGGARNIVCVVNGSGNLFLLSGFKGKLLRVISFPVLSVAYKLSKSVCFQNTDDVDLFRKKHLINKKTDIFVTGGSGVNLDKFPYEILPQEERFLFLARITPSKGIKEYIEAARIVKKTRPEVIFDIVGPLDSKVESKSNTELNDAINDGIVQYHGKTDDVPGWMSKCRFFVYPSYYPEGVPRCAIQAISSGRPIITCDTPGCKETVIDRVNGFLIPPQNSKELAEKMIWMLDHSNIVECMAVESRKLAEEKFNVFCINKTIIEKLL